MTDKEAPEQAGDEPVTYAKRIKSFVIRAGRMTPAQREGYTKHFGEKGLTLDSGMLDYHAIFGNDNPVVLEIGFGMGKSLVEMCQANPHLTTLAWKCTHQEWAKFYGMPTILMYKTCGYLKKMPSKC